MMMRPTRTLLLLPLVALLAACSGGDADTPTPYANTITQMTASIQKQLADSGATGGISIALVDDQTVVWAKSFGYADAGARTLATPDTAYRICSVTKTFTGTMIMQLSDQGLLDIGDPLTRFIPTFSIQPPLGFAAGGPITIRSILTHHSGIPGDIDNGVLTAAPDPDFNTKLVSYLQGEYLTYPTNFIWAYSNSAISLLATVISNASDKSFQTYSDQLFQTLGMDHTSVSIDSPNVATNQAKGYQAGREVPRFYNNGSTTGAIVSTIQDMAKFIKMVHAEGKGERGQVLKPETLEMMLTPQNGGIPLDFDNRIGLIWFLNDADLAYAGRICYHNGANPGFRSHLEILRDHNLGVVVLANDEQVPYEEIAKQALKLALQEKTGLTPTPFPEAPYSPAVAWDQARLDALQGVYVFSASLYASPVPFVKVRSVPGALEWTNPDDGTTVHVVPKANGWLSAPGSQTREYEFSEISGRNVMIWHGKGQSLLAAEYYTPPAIPAAWTARLGPYEATNCQSVFSCGTGSLIVADGMLGFGSNVLVPVSDTLAYICGLGRKGGSSVQILSVPPDGHEELQLLGVRYRKSANP
ncbi:MAG: beta-lactamase family protein [Proteobacteria bacterium]|nr:beta-lactamase family protein [Pseudomonadota bacterium]